MTSSSLTEQPPSNPARLNSNDSMMKCLLAQRLFLIIQPSYLFTPKGALDCRISGVVTLWPSDGSTRLPVTKRACFATALGRT